MNEFQVLSLFLSALGGGLGAAIAIFFNARIARAEREENRRKERINFLIDQQRLIVDQLHDASSGQRAGSDYIPMTRLREIIAISMTINDDEIDTICHNWYAHPNEFHQNMKKLVIPHNEDNAPETFVYLILDRIGEIIQETSKVD